MRARGPTSPLAPASDASTRLIRTLAVTVFLEWLGATSIVPMLPVYVRHLGGTDLLAGLVMASFFVAGVLFQYPLGRLADRVGRKPVLVGGLVVYGLASFAFLAPIVPAMAILLRGLQGLGAGASAIAALATVIRLACDGLWLCDLFGLASPHGSLRAAVGSAFERMTHTDADGSP